MSNFYLCETPDANYPSVAQGLLVRTSGRVYPVLDYTELTTKEQKEHDYAEAGQEFIRYRGWAHPMEEFIRVQGGVLGAAGWDGAAADSVWSGVCIARAGEGYKVGRYSQVSLRYANEQGVRVHPYVEETAQV